MLAGEPRKMPRIRRLRCNDNHVDPATSRPRPGHAPRHGRAHQVIAPCLGYGSSAGRRRATQDRIPRAGPARPGNREGRRASPGPVSGRQIRLSPWTSRSDTDRLSQGLPEMFPQHAARSSCPALRSRQERKGQVDHLGHVRSTSGRASSPGGSCRATQSKTDRARRRRSRASSVRAPVEQCATAAPPPDPPAAANPPPGSAASSAGAARPIAAQPVRHAPERVELAARPRPRS
jgi:hypothetical protein